MTRIRLAHWHDGHAPGDEIEVDSDQLRALQRDGRVAEVLPAYDEGGVLPPGVVEAVNETGAPEPVVTAPKRGRKAETTE
ncbi:hypothetical protein ACFRCG_39925 [Embleya sp. NPDC056575]|uniref:hypothetical protein n=1 Tax=unclassified Embleya TaxID=2699296 RepID=UPI0036765416